jgi:hypothetical protein
VPAPDDPLEPDCPDDAALADVLGRAESVPEPPEKAPILEVPDPEVVPEGVCAAAGTASALANSKARHSNNLGMKS